MPITLPRPRARKPAGNISAFEAERQFCKTTFGPKKPANGRPDGFGAARLPDLVLALDQDRQQLLFDVAAAVPALVDDQRFLVADLADLLFELAQGGLVHRLDVQVADAAVRELLDLLAALFHPAFVAKLAVGLAVKSARCASATRLLPSVCC